MTATTENHDHADLQKHTIDMVQVREMQTHLDTQERSILQSIEDTQDYMDTENSALISAGKRLPTRLFKTRAFRDALEHLHDYLAAVRFRQSHVQEYIQAQSDPELSKDLMNRESLHVQEQRKIRGIMGSIRSLISKTVSFVDPIAKTAADTIDTLAPGAKKLAAGAQEAMGLGGDALSLILHASKVGLQEIGATAQTAVDLGGMVGVAGINTGIVLGRGAETLGRWGINALYKTLLLPGNVIGNTINLIRGKATVPIGDLIAPRAATDTLASKLLPFKGLKPHQSLPALQLRNSANAPQTIDTTESHVPPAALPPPR